jgi:hypothetical protein
VHPDRQRAVLEAGGQGETSPTKLFLIRYKKILPA